MRWLLLLRLLLRRLRLLLLLLLRLLLRVVQRLAGRRSAPRVGEVWAGQAHGVVLIPTDGLRPLFDDGGHFRAWLGVGSMVVYSLLRRG